MSDPSSSYHGEQVIDHIWGSDYSKLDLRSQLEKDIYGALTSLATALISTTDIDDIDLFLPFKRRSIRDNQDVPHIGETRWAHVMLLNICLGNGKLEKNCILINVLLLRNAGSDVSRPSPIVETKVDQVTDTVEPPGPTGEEVHKYMNRTVN